MDIREATIADWTDIRRIYIDGIRTKNATFETEENVPTDGADWFSKKINGSILKAVGENGRMLGWAALSPVSARYVYRGVTENSIYIDHEAKGQGVGNTLLNALIEKSEAMGIWMIQTSIFPENKASIHLHEKHGFRILGTRERIAQLDGIWRDTTFMERRSTVIGY